MPTPPHTEDNQSLGQTPCIMKEKNNNRKLITKGGLSQPCQYIQATKIVKQKQDSKSLSKEIIHKLDINSLPLKKRFRAVLTKTAILTYSLHKVKKNEDINVKIDKNKKREVNIVPGVIRHTSCPDDSLAYYLNYDKE